MRQILQDSLPGRDVDIEFLDLGCHAFALENIVGQVDLGVDLYDILHAAYDIAVQTEILSAVLEPDAAGDEETGENAGNPDNPVNPDEENPESAENAEDSARTADALRTALAAFRPQLQRMSPQDRQRINADVAARMRKLTARSGKDRNPYAAIRGAAARPRDDRALGQKIMAARNVNRKN